MTPLTVYAARLKDGARVVLDSITELTVNDSLASPAAAMRCTAAIPSFPDGLGEVTVDFAGKTLFTGTVDKQLATLSGAGRLLQLEARSKGALLLDNEATPCVLTGARLGTVFNIFAAPYGFALYNPGDGRSLAVYAVQKGTSEWEALTGYTRRVYGRTPYLRGNQIVVDRPRSVYMLAIGKGGYPFTRLTRTLVPYNILSEVILRGADGNYSSTVRNPAAKDYNIRRKRYVIPSNEFMDNLALDANQRIRRSMLESERVSVTIPEIITVETGQEVKVLGDGFSLYNLIVEEITWRFGASGFTTELELINGFYYD